MPDKWAQYAQPATPAQNTGDKWAQYAQPAAAAKTPAAAPPAAPAPEPTMLQRIGSGAEDLGKGLVKGGMHTASTLLHVLNTPIAPVGGAPDQMFPTLTHTADKMETGSQTRGLMQKIGRGAEQIGEFLLPGAGEEDAAAHAAPILEKIPLIGKAAPTLSKMGASAAGAGLVNKVQGGTFKGGAETGAGGALLGAGLQKIAPTLAEAALKVRGTDRAYGRTPGLAILNETTGLRPGTIADQASGKVEGLSNELEDMARDSQEPASLLPAREAAERSVQAAYSRNNPSTYKKTVAMSKQLGEDIVGNELPEVTTPQQLLHIKRGIGDLQTSWNPATSPKWLGGQVGHVYHALDSELDRALPAGAQLNQRISSLMPVAQRATAADLNAGFTQRALGRLGAHTGALTGAALGGVAGYREGGAPGAVLGGIAGLAVPEIISSPEVQMGAARAFHSPVLRKIVIPAARGALLQMGRPHLFPSAGSQ